MEKTTLVILAGGKSSRFGTDKSLIEIDGKTLVETIVERCRPFFDEIFISSNADGKFKIPNVAELSDTYKERGPLGGIHSGLLASRNESVFFAACDMPHFNIDLALEIISRASGFEICVPRIGEKTEPLFGVYRRILIPRIESLLDADKRSIRALLDSSETHYFDCTAWLAGHNAADAFYNINYPQDFEKLEKNTTKPI